MREKDLPFYLFTNRPIYPLTHHLLGKNYEKGFSGPGVGRKKENIENEFCSGKNAENYFHLPLKPIEKDHLRKEERVFSQSSQTWKLFFHAILSGGHSGSPTSSWGSNGAAAAAAAAAAASLQINHEHLSRPTPMYGVDLSTHSPGELPPQYTA